MIDRPPRDERATKLRPWVVLGYMGGRVIPGLIILVSVSLWLRTFSAQTYGAFSVVQGAVLAGSALSTGWLRQASLRYAGRPGHGLLDQPVWILVATILGVVASAAVATGIVVGWIISPSGWLSIALFAGTNGGYLLTQVAVQRDGAILRFNLAEIARAGVGLGASLAFHAVGISSLVAIVLGNAAGNAAGLAVNFRPRRPALERVSRSERQALARASWKFGWPLSVWLGVASLTAYVDRFVLGVFSTSKILGQYTATADLVVRGLTMIAVPFVMAVHPIVMREHNSGRAGAAFIILRQWQVRMLAVLLAIVLLTALVGPQVVRLVLGQPTISRAALVVLAAGVALVQYSPLAHKKLEIAHRTRTLMTFAIVALSVQTTVSLSLVQWLGPLGVATGMLAGSVAYLALIRASQRAPRGKSSLDQPQFATSERNG